MTSFLIHLQEINELIDSEISVNDLEIITLRMNVEENIDEKKN